MAPEKVAGLIALTLDFAEGQLFGNGERIEIAGDDLYVSWYVGGNSKGYTPVAEGLVQIYDSPGIVRTPIDMARITRLKDGYRWRDPAPQGGPLMFAVALPEGYSVESKTTAPVEAKPHDSRIAVFWHMPEGRQVDLVWNLVPIEASSLADEIERLNQAGLDAMLAARDGIIFRYDVALSFAGEDRDYVEEVARLLKERNVRVFYDRFEEVDLWGKNLYDHLSKVYEKEARYTVMFISSHYVRKAWTGHERQSAQARAFRENAEYILPARFDDSEVPGLPATVAYLSLAGREPKDLVERIIRKLESAVET